MYMKTVVNSNKVQNCQLTLQTKIETKLLKQTSMLTLVTNTCELFTQGFPRW